MQTLEGSSAVIIAHAKHHPPPFAATTRRNSDETDEHVDKIYNADKDEDDKATFSP